VSVRVRHALVIVIAVVVAATCVRLALWQLDRLHGRRDVNAMLRAREDQVPIDIASAAPDAMPYASVIVDGTYDPTHEVILSGRSLDGVAGNHTLTPLVLDDGRAVIVDRGWVPLDVVSPPVTGPAAAPTGRVRVEGLALPPDSVSPASGEAAPSIVTRIDLGEVGLPYRLFPVYVLLQHQEPSQEAPAIVAPPGLDDGPHLSYAFQWFAFATIALVGGIVLVVRDVRAPTIAPGASPE
jgi:surfeit locus 1 family protein